jgi:parvulin-like peptidyl-prolyl isomerase
VDPQNPGSDEKFNKVLEANHLSANELKARIHESATVEALGKDLTKDNAVTENEVRQYFDKNPHFFKNEEEVRASHILVKDEAKAKELLAKLKGGADFAELAKANSLDGSKDKGGDLGFFRRGQMVPEFEQAAFALKPGELSGVVKSQFGYHLIKVTDKHPAVTKTFEQVKDDAKERLTKERQSEALQKWLVEARKGAKVEYKEGYAPAPTPAPPSPAASAAPAASGAAPVGTSIPTAKPQENPQNTTKGHAPTAAPSK